MIPSPIYGDSANIWRSLGVNHGMETPPPEEVNGQYFHDTLPELVLDETVQVDEEPLVAVIGVGYVGLHLVKTFSAKFKVVAFDVDEKRIATVSEELCALTNVVSTSSTAFLRRATHFLVSVPTTLLQDKRIDTSYVRSALATISMHARRGSTVVIESSVAVGMTRQLVSNLIRSRGFKAGMSPERVDPGRVEPPVSSIPKIVSGLDDISPGSLAAIQDLYSQVFDKVVPVSSPEVAEMTKLYENCQRMICIAYANEMSDACGARGINPFEVADAAATKPFGYLPFTPSLGVGGHCIPVNPYYLLVNNEFPLLRAATERMWSRPARLADEAMRNLAKRSDQGVGQTSGWPKVLVVGMGFKPGQAVLSCSPGVAAVKFLLEHCEADVCFADPLVEESALPYVPKLDEKTEWNRERLQEFDLILVAMRQTGLDFSVLQELRDVAIEEYTR